MAISTQIQNLNLIPGKSAPVVVHLSQGNVGNTVQFYLYDGDNPYYPTNVSIAVHGVRADNTVFGPYAVSVTSGSNLVSFDIVTAMTSVTGAAIGELVISDSNENQIGSANFGMLVEETPYSSSVTYEDDLSIYQRILAYVQSVPAGLQSQISTEVSARTEGFNSLQSQISTEVSTRTEEFNSLNTQLSEEVTSRQNTDTNLQNQINQIIAPSGEAPSAAEVQNARIAADGTVYSTLGDAIRNQVTGLKNDIGAEWVNKSISWWFGNASGTVGNKITIDSNTKTWSNIFIYPEDNKKYRAVAKSIGYATEVPLVFYLDSSNIILGTESVLSSETKYHTVDMTVPSGTAKIVVRNFMNGATTDSTFAVYERYKESVEARISKFDNYYRTLAQKKFEKYYAPSVGFYYYTPSDRKLSDSDSSAWSKALIDVRDLDLDSSIVVRSNGTFGRYVSGDAYIYGITFYDGGYSLINYIDIGSSLNQYDLTGKIPTGTRYITLNANRGSAFWVTGYKVVHPKKPVVFVASCEATDEEIQNADYVCNGSHDEVVIQNAINSLAGIGGTIKLSSGTFYIDAFPNSDDGGYTALLIPQNCYGVTIEGTLNGYAYETGTGTLIRVTASCYESLSASSIYTIIRGGYVNATLRSTLFLSVKSIRIVLPLNQKPICCIDYFYSNQAFCEFVTCVGWTEGYNDTHVTLTTPPPVAVENCVGIRMTGGSNYGVIDDYRNILATGFYEGFKVGGEHVVGINLSAIFDVYGYTFGNYVYTYAASHPITLINCCDERNVNLPYFVRCTDKQAVSLIDFNIERIAEYTPGGVLGDLAKEETPGMFCGDISYTIQTSYDSGTGSSVDVPFWNNGSGLRFVSKNSAHSLMCTSTERLTYAPNYAQKIWDTTLNKEVICTEPSTKTWKNSLGETV